MPKRRRTLGGEDGSNEEPDSSTMKRRRLRNVDSSEAYQEVYDAVRNYKSEDGHLLCEAFIRAPKKRSCAEYYEIVSAPMDLLKIQQKIKTDEYTDMEQLSRDFDLLITNAKTFYKRTTQEYRDACALWDVFCEAKQRTLSDPVARDEDSRSTDGGDKDNHDDEDNPFEELFASVMTASDTDGRFLSSMFQLLPSKTRYPDYYKIINEPIDLKTIACRIQSGQYTTLNDVEKDLLLLVKNAKSYNEPGSQIYKDAAQLRKIILNKKIELDQRKLTPAKTSERISLIISSGNGVRSPSVVRRPSASRAKRLAVGQKWSAITAALRYESDSEESSSSGQHNQGLVTTPQQPQPSFLQQDQSSFHCDENEDTGTNDSSPEDAAVNPQWQLYEAVKGFQNPPGYFMAEPFLRLPSRKLYPDYFREIKNPMSLFKISSRIKAAQYGSTMEVVDDMNIMFENAKRYNRPDSKLFKDAVRLQKVMQAKARELINFHMKESDSDGDCGEEEEEVSRSSSSGGPKRGPKPKKLTLGGTILTASEAKKYKKTTDFDVSLRKRLKILYKCLVDYADEYGRSLIPIFMEKPSAKDYPDYYEIIANPIDMKMIDWNIKNDKYNSEDQLVSDLRLMFSNCRHYNEEGSQIYRDANTLERILLLKVKELGPLFDPRGTSITTTPVIPSGPGRPPGKRGPHRRLTDLQYKLKTMYDTIREYTDSKGRKLSTIFLKLPTKSDYPDYYEVIKRPMDLEKINSKMRNSQYENLEDMLSDFILMFDNACKYNEPDSQIYKDALSLQRIALQTKLELSDPEDGVPDVRALIQELLTNLFTSVYNHQDEEGRCFSDSVVELSEADPANTDPSNPQAPLTLDIIKRNLNRGCYRRLDHFQEDMFEVFERARMVTRTDSQAFEDSIELQSFFVRKRDELCKNGSVLQSPALLYSEADLQASVESLRAQKLPCEAQQEADFENQPDKEAKVESEMSSSSDTVTFRGQTYHIGDFVYVEPREKGMEPHIIHIEKLWRDESGEYWISGCWFYRPLETFHLATRKFLQKEVFKSDNYNSTPLNQVIGQCYVMCVKDYFKFRPEGFDDQHVYVCESRYSARSKSFKKIKIWGCCLNSGSKIIPREEPLIPIRVPSAFKDGGVEKHKEDSMDFDDGDIAIIEKNKPNIVCDADNPEDGATYYEQFNLPIGLFKLGDYCYIRTESDKTLIARIDRMWADRTGNALFHGPWFLSPAELPQHSGIPRLFYKQELFMGCVEDTNPLLSVVGRCAVLDLKDYATCRPTEIPEEDVFICESKYVEAERQIRKFPKGLKKFQLSADVSQDEIYFFRNPVYPQKSEVLNTNIGMCRSSLFSPTVPETENEESNDMPPPSMPGADQQVLGTPLSTGKKKSSGKRLVTGYILFASEVRKSVVMANPDRTFGDISRMIGTEWRNLPQAKKADYEERAQKQNEEMAAREANTSLLSSISGGGGGSGWDSYPHSPASLHGGSNNSNSNQGLITQTESNSKEPEPTQVWECLWDSCDYQFEDLQDLLEHLLVEPKGHIFQTYTNPKAEGEYQCLWQNCARIKRNVPPFPNIQRLLRHCKEVHIKSASRNVASDARSQNFVASRKSSVSPVHTSNSNPASHATPNVASYTPIKVPDPIFVATPPKPQRLLHSNTYIRYIEGLNTENRWVGDWDQQLSARKENTPLPSDPPSLQRLPTHWLAQGAAAHHGDMLSALWALRDFMLRDALGIAKIAS